MGVTLTETTNAALRRVPTWVVYLAGGAWAVWLFYLSATGGMGVEPIKALEHELGRVALQLLIAGLAITPLRRHLGINLLRFRRAVGLLALFYVLLHLLVWLILDVQILSEIWRDIIKRPYITVGMLAFVLMVPLAVTSNNWSIRHLGARWHRLHKLVYLIALLGAFHFVLLARGFQIEPLLYLVAVFGLVALRFRPLGQRQPF